MKFTNGLSGLLSVLALSTVAFASPTTMSVVPDASQLEWTGKKVTGAHSGEVAIKSGEVFLTEGKVSGGKFNIDMSQIGVSDIKDPEYNKKLKDHLLSDDFFAASKFPEATFTITEAKEISGASAGEPNYQMKGTLNIKGIQNEVSFPATVAIDGDSASAKASVVLDRTKWNIRYGSGKFFEGLGDKLIYDDFVVDLDIKAKA